MVAVRSRAGSYLLPGFAAGTPTADARLPQRFKKCTFRLPSWPLR